MMRPTKRLFGLPRGASLTRVCFAALMVAFVSAGPVSAQEQEKQEQQKSYNEQVRKNTWSIYAQGGVSGASGLWYPNISASMFHNVAPAVGLGVDYNICPRVRVGVDYLFSRYTRQQRFLTVMDREDPTHLLYSDYKVNYHNAEATGQFSFLNPKRKKATWLNLYLGTGVGFMFARGNEYDITASTTVTNNNEVPKNVTTEVVVNNTTPSNTTIDAKLNGKNVATKFNQFYVPAIFTIEADVTRQFTVGLKGQANFAIARNDLAPKYTYYGLLTLRYNFVESSASLRAKDFARKLDDANGRINGLQNDLAAQKALAERNANEVANLKGQLANLQNDLDECNKKPVAPPVHHIVRFDKASHVVGKHEDEWLRAFLRRYPGKTLSLTAEASLEGETVYNQLLSERRLMSVLDIITDEGISAEVEQQTAIGADNKIDSPEGRRVIVYVK
ncbi:MAG: hypothetical protein HUK06_08695 [Bacteroidaceae bacterium]|nr:hypothetical protein [Bacteroidaceae bacterium]